jgi:AraC-like DNA-binding protein
MKKAKFEKIQPAFGSSFFLKAYDKHDFYNTPFWHFHPEYEIVYISNGKGKRHIGDHISYYENGDLIFLGPDLPHFGFTEEMMEEHLEIVLQMKEDFMGPEFLEKPELHQIAQLFDRARQGISFHGQTKEKAGEILSAMIDLKGFPRFLRLMELLHLLATTEEYQLLNANSFAFEVNSQDYPRLQAIYTYVENNFKEHISLDQMAKLVNMTPPAFSRYFKRLTGKTFIQFVNEYRIAYACKQLGEEDLPISEISFESGFNNISHFNKQFKLITGETPRTYRKNLKKVVKA